MFFRKPPLSELADRVVALARAGAPAADFQKAMKDCLQAAERAKGPEREKSLLALAPALSVPGDNHAFGAAFLCGALIEAGCAPGPIEEPLLQRYAALVTAARRFHAAVEAELPDDQDDPEAAFEEAARRVAPSMKEESVAFERLDQAFAPAVALLSVSPPARRRARAMLADLSAMSEDNAGASWLVKLCAVLEDEPYLAIEPATGQGIRGRMNGISENFQLNVLLMDLFPGPGGQRAPRVSPAAAANARGEGPQQLNEGVTGTWDLHGWPSLTSGGLLPQGTGGESTRHWIWNEGVPADIPIFEGLRVVLLVPASYPRSWGAQRSFAALRAELSVDQRLAGDEVQAWLARMAAAPRAPER
jgi:hypothetical protein